MDSSTLSNAPSPLEYYSPETNLFPALKQKFADTGQLHPEALYLILDWKAARARTRHLIRLAQLAGNFDKAAREIASDLHAAATPEQRLGVLMTKPKWGFLLPTASAILTVLYPDTFTVYDRRVCQVLGDFERLINMMWSVELWREYQRFVMAVRAGAIRAAAPTECSLRDCDRWLWGMDKRKTMLDDLANIGDKIGT